MTYTHKHYEVASRAHHNTSFSPERRGESLCKYYDETMEQLKSIGCSPEGLAKFERLFLAAMAAKGRCISGMITGPANFPVRRAERANDAERKASDEMYNYPDKVRKAIDKKNNPHKYGIRADQPDALELLRAKLIGLERGHAQMIAVNKLIRAGKGNPDKVAIAEIIGDNAMENILKPDFMGRIGFASYSLSLSKANIKRIKDRITGLEKREGQKTKEHDIEGVRVVENVEQNRLQLHFDGKPPSEVITRLKKHGFRWSPRNTAWQRQLTNNAIYSFKLLREEGLTA